MYQSSRTWRKGWSPMRVIPFLCLALLFLSSIPASAQIDRDRAIAERLGMTVRDLTEDELSDIGLDPRIAINGLYRVWCIDITQSGNLPNWVSLYMCGHTTFQSYIDEDEGEKLAATQPQHRQQSEEQVDIDPLRDMNAAPEGVAATETPGSLLFPGVTLSQLNQMRNAASSQSLLAQLGNIDDGINVKRSIFDTARKRTSFAELDRLLPQKNEVATRADEDALLGVKQLAESVQRNAAVIGHASRMFLLVEMASTSQSNWYLRSVGRTRVCLSAHFSSSVMWQLDRAECDGAGQPDAAAIKSTCVSGTRCVVKFFTTDILFADEEARKEFAKTLETPYPKEFVIGVRMDVEKGVRDAQVATPGERSLAGIDDGIGEVQPSDHAGDSNYESTTTIGVNQHAITSQCRWSGTEWLCYEACHYVGRVWSCSEDYTVVYRSEYRENHRIGWWLVFLCIFFWLLVLLACGFPGELWSVDPAVVVDHTHIHHCHDDDPSPIILNVNNTAKATNNNNAQAKQGKRQVIGHAAEKRHVNHVQTLHEL